jgi:hypothetical protein
MQIRRTAAALTSAAALSVTGIAMATPAQAAPIFTGGLVNITIVDAVDITDNVVQVPVGVAVNVCNVSIAAVFAVAGTDGAACEAFNEQLPMAFRQ